MKQIAELYKLSKDIDYNDDDHTYTNNITGHIYQSVTGAKSKFKKKVDWTYWKLYKALQAERNIVSYRPELVEQRKYFVNGVVRDFYKASAMADITVIDKEWKDKAKVGTDHGTKIHNYLEFGWQGKFPKERIDYLDKYLREYRQFLSPIGLEVIVGDDGLDLFGQFDGLFYHDNGKIQLRDTKTDKEFKEAYKDAKLLYPFHEIPASTLGEYTIQLNLYCLIIEHNTSIVIDDLIIDYFDREGKYTEIKVEKLNLDYDVIRGIINP